MTHIILWVIKMNFNIGDLVTRKSYHNDTVFKIINLEDEVAYLKGVNIRLYADSFLDDLSLHEEEESELIEKDNRAFKKATIVGKLNRDEFFYLPGKILHIDGDKDYLDRCMQKKKKCRIILRSI